MRSVLAVVACLLLVGCTSFEVLEPSHLMAVENQQNLEANVDTLTTAFVEVATTHQDYAESDKAVIDELVKTVKEQTAIASAYIALVGVYIEGRKVNAKAFEKLLMEIPTLVAEGKDIWDELQALIHKEDE